MHPRRSTFTSSGALFVVRGLGGGAVTTPITTLEVGWLKQLSIRDFDGDGKVDVLALGQWLAALRGNGDGTFGAPVVAPWIIGNPARDTALADFDGDGRLDVVFQSAAFTVGIARNLGDLAFDKPLDFEAGTMTTRVADVDDDGLLDIVTDDAMGGVSVLQGRCL